MQFNNPPDFVPNLNDDGFLRQYSRKPGSLGFWARATGHLAWIRT